MRKCAHSCPQALPLSSDPGGAQSAGQLFLKTDNKGDQLKSPFADAPYLRASSISIGGHENAPSPEHTYFSDTPKGASTLLVVGVSCSCLVGCEGVCLLHLPLLRYILKSRSHSIPQATGWTKESCTLTLVITAVSYRR